MFLYVIVLFLKNVISNEIENIFSSSLNNCNKLYIQVNFCGDYSVFSSEANACWFFFYSLYFCSFKPARGFEMFCLNRFTARNISKHLKLNEKKRSIVLLDQGRSTIGFESVLESSINKLLKWFFFFILFRFGRSVIDSNVIVIVFMHFQLY